LKFEIPHPLPKRKEMKRRKKIETKLKNRKEVLHG